MHQNLDVDVARIHPDLHAIDGPMRDPSKRVGHIIWLNRRIWHRSYQVPAGCTEEAEDLIFDAGIVGRDDEHLDPLEYTLAGHRGALYHIQFRPLKKDSDHQHNY